MREGNILVESSCSLENLLFLYKIKAFKNTNNWNKLLISIGLLLGGRRYKIKLRFIDLSKIRFSSFTLRDRYNIVLQGANDWISNMINFGYVSLVSSSNKPYKYRLTLKALAEGKVLFNVNREIKNINNNNQNLWDLLDRFKVKSLKNIN